MLNCAGQAVQINQCGVYRDMNYQLLDQNGQPFAAAYSITEAISDYATTISGGSQPSNKTANISAGGILEDLQYLGVTSPSCPGSNDHDSFTQQFTVQVVGSVFPLTTIIDLSRGNFSGTTELNVTMVHQ